MSGDPVVTYLEPHIAQINRLGTDTIRIYDPNTWGAPLLEFSVGSGANPHAVIACNDELWASLYGRAHIGRYIDGERVGEIDLSAFADDDGIPEASDMIRIGDDVYVVLQRLNRNDRWTADPNGRVVHLSCTDKSIVDVWDVGPNPRLSASAETHVWVTPDSGPFHRFESTTQIVDTVSFDFGTYTPKQTAWSSETNGMTIGYEEGLGFSLFCLNTELGETTLAYETAHYLTDIRRVGAKIWVSARRSWLDTTALGGLMVWDAETCTQETPDDWIRTELDPVSITWIPTQK